MQLIRGGAVGAVAKIAGTLIAMVLAVLLARALGPAQYGIYAYVFALVTLLAVPVQLGLPTLVVRETATAFATGRWGRMRGVWRWSGVAAGLLSVSVIGVGATTAWLFADRFSGGALQTFAWGLVLLPLVAFGALRAAALRGLDELARGLVAEHVLRTGLLAVLVAAAWVFREDGLSAARAMSLHVLAAALAVGIATGWLHRARPRAAMGALRDYDHDAWLRSALPLALVAGMHLVNTRADILMLGLFAPPDEVGVYQVAVSGASLVILGLTALNLVVAPQFARLHAAGDTAALQRLVTRGSRLVLLTTLPVAVLMVFGGGEVVRIVFGAEYAAAERPLAILAAGQLVNAAFGSVGVLLNMTHNERATARGVMVAAGLNIALNLLLIPRYGTTGAAVATATSFVVWNLLLWRSAQRLLSVNTLAFGAQRR